MNLDGTPKNGGHRRAAAAGHDQSRNSEGWTNSGRNQGRSRASNSEVSQPNGEVIGQWQLGSRLVMRKLDREAKIAPGDPVLSAGISRALLLDAPAARIPPNIPIGIVSAVRPSGHAQEADVQPYFDPDEVRTVWIIVGVD